MNYFIDSHAHIYHEDFVIDRNDMLHRCEEQGVKKIFMPNVDHMSIDAMLELESRYQGTCYAMMGVHPCSIKKNFEKELYLVEEWLSKRRFSAVGEIGTDLYWDKTFFEQQKEAFTVQVNWARQYALPIVIHCRESIDQTIALVEHEQDGNLTGVFHCFSGTAEQAARVVKLGFYLGIGGVVTFKNGGLDSVIPEIDLAHLVLETDSPYLAPVPHRGKRNEPSYISLVAKKIADLKNCTMEEVQDITTSNALKLFNCDT
ncbi:MAG: TatD family hydrolase [Cyclobacteriaceae bacterium]|nr:TatD family hydrolase [Cyclobacteriaceae bacterium]MDH5248691.1 TatD family hydrolase [Cyclobacteriaceae bacterium]